PQLVEGRLDLFLRFYFNQFSGLEIEHFVRRCNCSLDRRWLRVPVASRGYRPQGIACGGDHAFIAQVPQKHTYPLRWMVIVCGGWQEIGILAPDVRHFRMTVQRHESSPVS